MSIYIDKIEPNDAKTISVHTARVSAILEHCNSLIAVKKRIQSDSRMDHMELV